MLPWVVCPILSDKVAIILHLRCVYLAKIWVKLNFNFTRLIFSAKHSERSESQDSFPSISLFKSFASQGKSVSPVTLIG